MLELLCAAAAAGACTTEAWLEVEFSRVEAAVVGVGVVDDDDVAGSATSLAPVMERKPSASGGAAAVEVMLAAIRLLQMTGTLGATLSLRWVHTVVRVDEGE